MPAGLLVIRVSSLPFHRTSLYFSADGLTSLNTQKKKEAEPLLLPFPHQRLLLGLFGSIQRSKKPSGPSPKDTFACVAFLSILVVLVWWKCLHFLQYDGSGRIHRLCCEQFSSEYLSFCVTVQKYAWIHSWASGELTALAGVAAQARTMALTFASSYVNNCFALLHTDMLLRCLYMG